MIRLLRAREGTAAIEFAFIAPLFFMLLFLIMEYSLFYWSRSTIQFAAEDAARYAMVATAATDADVAARVRQRASDLDQSRLTVAVSRDVSNGIVFIVIDAQYDWSSHLTNYFPTGLTSASGRARMPLSN